MVLHNGVLFGMVLKSPSAVRILKYRLLWAAHIARLEQMTTQNNEQQVRGCLVNRLRMGGDGNGSGATS
jgi:hypothetical protein